MSGTLFPEELMNALFSDDSDIYRAMVYNSNLGYDVLHFDFHHYDIRVWFDSKDLCVYVNYWRFDSTKLSQDLIVEKLVENLKDLSAGSSKSFYYEFNDYKNRYDGKFSPRFEEDFHRLLREFESRYAALKLSVFL